MKRSNSDIVATVIGWFLAILLIAVIAAVINVIPWFLYNHGIAPIFGWRHAGYWQTFLVVWAVVYLRKLLFPDRK